MPYTNSLQISPTEKGIPYGGTGDTRDDGDANYGFKNLKGHLERLDEIPELQRDAALHDLIAAINAPTTGLFSVGCTSGPVAEGGGQRVTGYVEFSFTSAEAVTDAGRYFPAFFHFDRMLRAAGFDENFHFVWELMGARFVEADVDGFTATIYLNTGFHETAAAAAETWAVSLDLVGQFLASIPPSAGDVLYPREVEIAL